MCECVWCTLHIDDKTMAKRIMSRKCSYHTYIHTHTLSPSVKNSRCMFAICFEWRRANNIKLNVLPLFEVIEEKRTRRQCEMTLTRRTRMQSLLHASHKCEHILDFLARLSAIFSFSLYFLVDAVGSIVFLHLFDSSSYHQFPQIHNAFFTRKEMLVLFAFNLSSLHLFWFAFLYHCCTMFLCQKQE